MSARNHQEECARKNHREEEMWVFGVKLIIQLVTGVQNNPGPRVRQDKIDQLQFHVKNQKQTTFIKGTITKLVTWKREP
jgi:hypothetical protein